MIAVIVVAMVASILLAAYGLYRLAGWHGFMSRHSDWNEAAWLARRVNYQPKGHIMHYYQILVDGIPWEDSDGQTEWTLTEAISLVEHLFRQGYTDVEYERTQDSMGLVTYGHVWDRY